MGEHFGDDPALLKEKFSLHSPYRGEDFLYLFLIFEHDPTVGGKREFIKQDPVQHVSQRVNISSLWFEHIFLFLSFALFYDRIVRFPAANGSVHFTVFHHDILLLWLQPGGGAFELIPIAAAVGRSKVLNFDHIVFSDEDVLDINEIADIMLV